MHKTESEKLSYEMARHRETYKEFLNWEKIRNQRKHFRKRYGKYHKENKQWKREKWKRTQMKKKIKKN